jgi:hypothetical protein
MLAGKDMTGEPLVKKCTFVPPSWSKLNAGFPLASNA